LPEALTGDELKGRQLRTSLEAMLSGMAPGALLPSERVLAERLRVARGTVRHQIDQLVAEGRVRRVPGRGTFVSPPRFVQTQKMSGFSRDMISRGMRPSSQVLSLRLHDSPATVAERLEIAVGAPVVELFRIRFADDEPMALERTNLPAGRFPGLEAVNLDQRSLYDVLATDYGCQVDSADQRVSVRLLSGAEAKRLYTEPGSPAFDIERVTRDNMGTVVEYGHAVLRGDRYDILMHVEP
jgi:GntR family transcriptional regulator